MKMSFFTFVKTVSLIETQSELPACSLLNHIINFSMFILLVSLTTGGSDPNVGNDLHGRNLVTGKYFTLVQGGHKGGIGTLAETTGLAFTRDNLYLYVAFQSQRVYEFHRLDGKPFDGVVADTKYHTESP